MEENFNYQLCIYSLSKLSNDGYTIYTLANDAFTTTLDITLNVIIFVGNRKRQNKLFASQLAVRTRTDQTCLIKRGNDKQIGFYYSDLNTSQFNLISG